MRKIAFLAALLLLLTGCTPTRAPSLSAPLNFTDNLRGIWVSFIELDAAFANADMVSARAYINAVMDRVQADGFNTVFWHVRAHGDAYYASDVFPVADSVKGLLGGGFDPLAYAIQAAHTRGLSLHVWINPYRLGADATEAVCKDVYGWEDTFYYVPSSLTVQRCILDGVRELVEGYSIDGVQFDDYFYPVGLPSEACAFEAFPNGISVAEGRRAAVNALIAATYAVVHSREGLLFGVSPTGNLTRNRDLLYADTARWLAVSGYVDYLCPQLYSGFENETLPFETQLADFAVLPRVDGVRLYAGLALYKTGETDAFAGKGAAEWQQNGDVLARQIRLAQENGCNGVSLFRYDHWTAEGNTIRQQERDAVKAIFS